MAATNPENFGIALDDIIRKKKKEEKLQARAVHSRSPESQEDRKRLYRAACRTGARRALRRPAQARTRS